MQPYHHEVSPVAQLPHFEAERQQQFAACAKACVDPPAGAGFGYSRIAGSTSSAATAIASVSVASLRFKAVGSSRRILGGPSMTASHTSVAQVDFPAPGHPVAIANPAVEVSSDLTAASVSGSLVYLSLFSRVASFGKAARKLPGGRWLGPTKSMIYCHHCDTRLQSFNP
ncbi:hypothetical protein BGZ61DRAFT_443568 [Ilyonectria robusta]|uniref:uncharacterized protein n=1 Tax=Ilyonectria robusta TaxID=1079257 RepID=UPI001E8D30D3|nr:uncharacterized protein BGZ61DRAFT_443568 [Ilyonectria robusta]KAH8735019.1 hypothetical protein BGZ61DRAFT_443568 [Ilyonectria robusta]